ncbi:MAG: AEC family transporter [Mycobacterium sp.]
MLAVLQAFAVIAVVIAVGAVVGRTGVLGDNARMVLNRVAFHVGVPALLLLSLAESTPSQVFSLTLLISVIATLSVFGLYFAIATVLRRKTRGDATIGAWASSVVNAGNLGIPLSAYVLGSTTEISAIIVFQSVLLVPMGIAIITSEGGDSRSTRDRLKDLVTNPIIAASAIGLTLAITDVELPTPIKDPLTFLADLAIPTVLLAFGIALSTQPARPARENRVDIVLSVFFKVALMPAVAYAVGRWGFGASHEQLAVVTVLAALPAAQNINTYAAVYQRGESLARDSTLISTAVSVPVMVLIAFLMGL